MTFLVFIYVKLTTRDLFRDFYPQHPTSIYTCRVTIAPGVHSGAIKSFKVLKIIATIVNAILH